MLERINPVENKIEKYSLVLLGLRGGVLVWEKLFDEPDVDEIIQGLGLEFMDKVLTQSGSFFSLPHQKRRLPPLLGFRKVLILSVKLFGAEQMPNVRSLSHMMLRDVIKGSVLEAGSAGTAEMVSRVNDFMVPILELYPEFFDDKELRQDLSDVFTQSCRQFHLNSSTSFSWNGSYLLLKLAQVFDYGLDSNELLSVVESQAEVFLNLECLSWDPELFLWMEETFPQARVDFKSLREAYVRKTVHGFGDILMPNSSSLPIEVEAQHLGYALPLIAKTFSASAGEYDKTYEVDCFGAVLLNSQVVRLVNTNANRAHLLKIFAFAGFDSDLRVELESVYGDFDMSLDSFIGSKLDGIKEALLDVSATYEVDHSEPRCEVGILWSDDWTVPPRLPDLVQGSLSNRVDMMTSFPKVFEPITKDIVSSRRTSYMNISPSNEEVEEIIMNYETRRNCLQRDFDEHQDLKRSLSLVLKWFYDENYFEYVRNESSVVTAFSQHRHGNCDTRETAMGTLIMDALSVSLDLEGLFVETLKGHVRLVAVVNGEWLLLEGKKLQAYTPIKGTTLSNWEGMYKAVETNSKAPVDFDFRSDVQDTFTKPESVVQSVARAVLDRIGEEAPQNSVAAKTLPVVQAEYQTPVTSLTERVQDRIKGLMRKKQGSPLRQTLVGSMPMFSLRNISVSMSTVLAGLYLMSPSGEVSSSFYASDMPVPMTVTHVPSVYEQMLMNNVMSYDGTEAVLNPAVSGVINLSESNVVIKKSGWEVLFKEGADQLIMNGENLDLSASLRELRAALPKLNMEQSIELNSGQLGQITIFIDGEGVMQVEGEVRGFNLSEQRDLEVATHLMLQDQGRF